MKNKRYILIIFLAFFSIRFSLAQMVPPNPSLVSLQHYVTKVQRNTFDSSYTDLHYVIGENINYLYPLYQLLGDGKKFMGDFSIPIERLAGAIALAFADMPLSLRAGL